jgi:hypothetical protein
MNRNPLARPAIARRQHLEKPRGVVLGAYRKPRERDPFHCPHCFSNFLQPFSAIYANGSSTTRYRKGLFIKTGWAESKRQTLMAENCAPPMPRKMPWRVALTLLGMAMAYPWSFLDGRPQAGDFLAVGGVMAVIGIAVTTYAVRWNLYHYPKAMRRYSETYHCRRCGTVCYIKVEDGS